MIRRLRIKFVCINMSIVTGMLLVIFGILLVSTGEDLRRQSMQTVQLAMVELGFSQRPGEPENTMPGDWEPRGGDGWNVGRPGEREQLARPWFCVTTDAQGQRSVISNGYYDLSDETLMEEILRQTENSPEKTGVLRQYNLRFIRDLWPSGEWILFVDMSGEIATMTGMLKTCLVVGVMSLAAFFLVSLLLARWAVRPVEKAWDQQRQFVADASHELKTPLTVIMTNAELLQQPLYGAAERQRFADNILVMSRQMRELVERLLDLARVDNGTAKMEFSRLDFSALVEDVLLPFEPMYFEHQLQLESKIEAGITLQGSENHLRQVLDILLDNGVKYTPAGETVWVRLVRSGGSCLLSVVGPGDPLSREDLRRIFERFYRIDKARHRDGSYGLGLAIAKSIITQHRGKIWAESEDGINTFFVQLSCSN